MMKGNGDVVSKLMRSTDRLGFFRTLAPNKRGFVLLGLPKRVQQELMNSLSDEELVELLNYLDPDKITDLLYNIKPRRRERILKKFSEAMKKKVEFLLKFDPRTAAGIMSLDYVEVSKDMTFEEVSKLIEKHEKRTGKFPALLVVEDGYPVGELPAHVLALGKRKEKVGKYVKHVPMIRYDKDESCLLYTSPSPRD